MVNKNKKLYFIYAFLMLMVFLTLFINILTKYVEEKNKKPTYLDIVAIIKSATNTYATKNKELTNKLFYTNRFIDIKYKTLKDEKILKDDLYNPLTKQKISDDDTIRISLTKNNLINIVYPVKKHSEGYEMFANNLIIDYDKNTDDKKWCNDPYETYKGLFGSTYEGITSSKMGLVFYSKDVSKSGLYYDQNYFDPKVNLKIKKCNVNPSVSKNYKLVYSYINPTNNKEEEITRKITVRKSSYDIIKFEAKLDEKTIKYKQDKIPITINETTRSYIKNEHKYFIINKDGLYIIVNEKNEPTDYEIVGFTSNKIYSNLKCEISKKTVNSDKTKPTNQKILYKVVEK